MLLDLCRTGRIDCRHSLIAVNLYGFDLLACHGDISSETIGAIITDFKLVDTVQERVAGSCPPDRNGGQCNRLIQQLQVTFLTNLSAHLRNSFTHTQTFMPEQYHGDNGDQYQKRAEGKHEAI
jgi:hypothetical protein